MILANALILDTMQHEGVKGTRIPVHQIIRMLANGDKIQELLEDYPSIKVEDIYACLDYAASLAEEQITPIDMTESAI